MLRELDIYFDDLNDEAKEAVEARFGPAADHNWDVFPLFTITEEVEEG